MPDPKTLTIGFVRRGYSASGGAEAYLKRLAEGVVGLGHEVRLFTTTEWPDKEWPFGQMTKLRWNSPIGFADELEKLRAQVPCDVLMSLERVWSCDVYRAGDGVHQAWLDRRKKFESRGQSLLRGFNTKHRDILRLEKSLFEERKAERVIVNSKMVKDEIFDTYCYRPDQIDVIRNGVPVDRFKFDPKVREQARADLGLTPELTTLLFVGSGWERKGLRFAIDALKKVEQPNLRLLVAGRDDPDRYQAPRVQFLGELTNLRPIYFASDIFILPTIYDPFSNASLEALAAGLPVITTRANGFSEIMEDRIHGSVVDRADNIVDLRNAIEQWAVPTRRSAARPSILKRASQYDISKNVEATLAILLQQAAKRKP